jgi:nucleoside-diphosphate-sugar epimerase
MQSRFGDRVVPLLKSGKGVQLLGGIEHLHSWTAPADVADLMRIVATEPKAWGKAWHVPSNTPKTQREVVLDIAKELGLKDVKVGSVSPGILRVLGLFNPVIRELNNGSYQFNAPFVIDDSAARKTFGVKPTPWDVMIKKLVSAYK